MTGASGLRSYIELACVREIESNSFGLTVLPVVDGLLARRLYDM